MSKIIEKFNVLHEFKQRIEILDICENDQNIENDNEFVLKGYNVLIVTKDKTYAFGINDYGLLGFGHNIVVTEPQIVEQLCELIVLMN
jgi:hypothetical protein